MSKNMPVSAFIALVGLLIVAGCGGGGSGDQSQQPPVVTNTPPTANAGTIQNVRVGTMVTLDGSASTDANGDVLTFRWSLVAPNGSGATLNSATARMPAFVADVSGTYSATLVVSDGRIDSAAATVVITASLANVAPVADAGTAQNVLAGNLVTLNGLASSDANGDALTYSWTLDGRPAGSNAALSSATSSRPTFIADLAGAYSASLTVSDGNVSSMPSSVTITVGDIVDGRYRLNSNGTVTDLTTDLVWMRCRIGQSWDGVSCTGTPTPYAWLYATRLNGTVSFASYSDWRLPTVRELDSLVTRPSIATFAFNDQVFKEPQEPSSYWGALWTATEWWNLAEDAAWDVSRTGRLVYAYKGGQRAALLVRGNSAGRKLSLDRAESDYSVNDGVATHLPSGLMWKRCSEGQVWDGVTCSGFEQVYTAAGAAAIRDAYAGHTDWRLPTIEEQLTLVSYATTQRPINSNIFPSTPRTFAWSRSPMSSVPGYFWTVDFGFSFGVAVEMSGSATYPVRLVRRPN